ncbi:MAG: lmo0937 family membrane protein [Microcystis flos-aquae Mf_WU_F_19750830_S460]|uniref:Lmo0937 family membrane protein n=1 Tax=Microcystis flos-aquae Mf_WU_F_19750830_S460 TaxID=2486237 RepID=A0A552LMS8_9CHRO|nr:MAG: lmo0937 family membrane protein [Microcystis flos-aquae Mf_WU_F_19750830_S460]
MFDLVWTAVVILFILWLLGFSVNIGGGLIHLLLVLVLIGVVYNLNLHCRKFPKLPLCPAML